MGPINSFLGEGSQLRKDVVAQLDILRVPRWC